MAGPWERYRTREQTGPWAKYGSPAPQRPESGLNERTHVAAGGLLEGIPVVGPMLRGGGDRIGAGIRSVMYGTPYQDELEFVQGRSEELKQEMPILNTATQIGGAVGGTIPLVLAAPAAFGAGSAPMLARMGAGALSGGALGGTDAGVRSGGDVEAIKSGIGWGVGMGAAGPPVGAAIGRGVGNIASWLRGPGGARGAAGAAALADGVDDVAARLQAMGPDAMPMDLGPNLQRQAGALAATPGRAQEIVRSAVGARDAAANMRIRGALDQTLGPTPLPSAIDDAIAAGQERLGAAYEQVFRNARRVDTSTLAGNLESQAVRYRGEAQRAAQRVRKMLDVTGTDQLDPNPYTLFQTRQAIDGMMQTEADGKAKLVLSAARKQIDDMLAKAVPGIKKVDAQYAELARQREALGRGQQALDSGRTAPRPEELAREFSEGALPQGQQIGPSAVPLRLQQGARAEIERIVGTNANDRVALQRLVKGEGDWNRARLATLFGNEKADRIIRVLNTERAFSDTSQIVTKGPETAARIAAQRTIGTGENQPGLVRNVFNMRFGDTLAGIGDKAVGSARRAAQDQFNAELAEILSSRDPRVLQLATRAVMAARQRGDITADHAKKLTNAILIGNTQQRRPLELTVTPSR